MAGRQLSSQLHTSNGIGQVSLRRSDRKGRLDPFLSSPGTTEKQDIAVGVLELETAHTVFSVCKRLENLDIARSKFGRQCIRVRDVDVCVPTGDALFDVSRVVGHWSYANLFEQNLGTAPANDPKEDVFRNRPLEG